jgi:hypothetical protein
MMAYCHIGATVKLRWIRGSDKQNIYLLHQKLLLATTYSVLTLKCIVGCKRKSSCSPKGDTEGLNVVDLSTDTILLLKLRRATDLFRW